MNTIRLQGFESADLVDEFYEAVHGRTMSASKRRSIVSSFRQGRSLLDSAEQTDAIAKPIVQYYGLAAISRGLVLTLDSDSSESSLAAAHGLTFQSGADLAEATLTTSKGLFMELAGVLQLPHGNTYQLASAARLDFARLCGMVPPLGSQFEQWIGGAGLPRLHLQSVQHDPSVSRER